MPSLNCLIVEDEPLAVSILKEYVEQVPGLNLRGSYGDAVAALDHLRRERVDLIFLDINLPKINGLDFLRSLKGKYPVILTTAYHQYALDGFDLDVVDYLLKPIELSRFLQAVDKVFERMNPLRIVPAPTSAHERKYTFFNVGKKQVKVFEDEVLYIESLKDYVRIHMPQGNLVTKFQIGEMDRQLEESRFLRIHKSFLINIERVTAYSAYEVEVGGIALPIGRTYKELVEKRLNPR